MNRITPFIKRLRTNGGTIYTFSSAIEDIGLNINERNNVVKISHFALLQIPPIDEPDDIKENKFNVRAIAGNWEYEQNNASLKDGKVLIAESFENYALNLETNLLNLPSYNASLSKTVSERVFWKWLKETGAIRWDIGPNSGGNQYWSEELDADGAAGYNSVVKYIGQVSAGNLRTDSFGTYNETYVLVPTSHGQTSVFFNTIEDDNYYHGLEIGNLGEKILGRENYTLPHPDALDFRAYYDFVDSSTLLGNFNTFYDNSTGSYSPGWWYSAEGIEPASIDNAYIIDNSSYISSGIYHTDLKYEYGSSIIEFRRSKVDCMSLVLDLNKLKDIYSDPALTYDSIATKYSINDNYDFNAVLIYYTIYNSTMDEVLGTNLMGVLFMDAPSGNTSYIGAGGIVIPSLEKIQSGPVGFGTSYSFRLNIKTNSLLDDTQALISDFATSDQIYAEDWAGAFSNLSEAVNILSKNNSVLNYISDQYKSLQNTQTQIVNDVEELTFKINDTVEDIKGTNNTIAMFSDGDDPLIDSSIHMRFGNIGFFIDNPQYPVQIDKTIKTKEIIIENAIRDTSNNILIGYGSPLQVGASTNKRDITFYAGNSEPAMKIDASSNSVAITNDVSIEGTLYIGGVSIQRGDVFIDGSVYYTGPVYFESSIYYEGNSKRYLVIPDDLGSGLNWDGNLLNTTPSSDVSAAGVTGWVQVNKSGGLYAYSDFLWDDTLNKLSINGDVSINGDLKIGGTFDIDGSLSVPGNILIGGNTQIGGNTNVIGDISVNGVIKSGQINSTSINSSGDVSVNSSLKSVSLKTGNINSSGDVSIFGNLYSSLPSGTESNVVYFNSTSKRFSYGAPTGGGGGEIGGSGTANYLAKFTSNSSIGNSYLIEKSNRIGLGVTDPSAAFHVADTILIGTQYGSGFSPYPFVINGSTASMAISRSGGPEPTIILQAPENGGSGGSISGISSTSGGIRFSSNIVSQDWMICTSTSLRINSSKILIGTGVNVPQISAGTSTSTRISSIYGYIDVGPQSTTYAHIYTDRNPSDGFYFNAVLRGSDFILTSDERYKKNIENIENSLDKILHLEPIYFNWNEEAKSIDRYSEIKEIGLIAQRVEGIIPEIVNTASDGVKSISYSKLSVINSGAIKELNDKIIYLENRIEELSNLIKNNLKI